MSYATGTTNYDLPQYVGTDTPSWVDTNEPFEAIDSALGGMVTTTSTLGSRVTALETTVTGDGGVIETIAEIQSDVTTLEGTVSGHTTSISNLNDEVDDVRDDCEDMICAVEETSATAAYAHEPYPTGTNYYFRYNDILYKTTASIAVGDTIVPNTNCEATNVATELGSVTISDNLYASGDTFQDVFAKVVEYISGIDSINEKEVFVNRQVSSTSVEKYILTTYSSGTIHLIGGRGAGIYVINATSTTLTWLELVCNVSPVTSATTVTGTDSPGTSEEWYVTVR